MPPSPPRPPEPPEPPTPTGILCEKTLPASDPPAPPLPPLPPETVLFWIWSRMSETVPPMIAIPPPEPVPPEPPAAPPHGVTSRGTIASVGPLVAFPSGTTGDCTKEGTSAVPAMTARAPWHRRRRHHRHKSGQSRPGRRFRPRPRLPRCLSPPTWSTKACHRPCRCRRRYRCLRFRPVATGRHCRPHRHCRRCSHSHRKNLLGREPLRPLPPSPPCRHRLQTRPAPPRLRRRWLRMRTTRPSFPPFRLERNPGKK